MNTIVLFVDVSLSKIIENIPWIFSGIGVLVIVMLISFVKVLLRRIQRLRGRSEDRNPEVVQSTDEYLSMIYKNYANCLPNHPVHTCTSSWIIEKKKIPILEKLEGNPIEFLGPIDDSRQMLGVLWRLGISLRRKNKPPFAFFHRGTPGIKFVVVGNNVVVSDSHDETPSVTGKGWNEFPALAKLLTNFFSDLKQEAIPLPKHLSQRLATYIKSQKGHKATIPQVVTEIIGNEDHVDFPRTSQEQILTAYLKQIQLQIKVALFAKEDNPQVILTEPRSTNFGVLPAVRIVIFPHCNLHCQYCPENDENYSHVGQNITGKDFSFFTGCCRQMGFTEFRFTGGEPLLAVPVLQKCIQDNALFDSTCRTYIATNGTLLEGLTDKFSSHPNLTLKVSLDTLDSKIFARQTGSTSDTFKSILRGLDECKSKFRVGINCVVTRETQENIPQLLDFILEKGFYLKILDLNNYMDLPEGYWESNYVPTSSFVDKYAPLYNEHMVSSPGGYGIPMVEFLISDKSFLRIKDSRRGATYAPLCLDPACPFFPCQEGVYQLTLTSDGILKVCRHRKDYGVDISSALRCRDTKAVCKALQLQMDRFFTPAFFYHHEGLFHTFNSARLQKPTIG